MNTSKMFSVLLMALILSASGGAEDSSIRQFRPEQLSKKQLTLCAAIKKAAQPRDPALLEELIWMQVLPITGGGVEPYFWPGKVTAKSPSILMSREDVILLLGPPNSEDNDELAYAGYNGRKSVTLSIYLDKGYVVQCLLDGSQ